MNPNVHEIAILDKKLHASKCKQFYQFPKDISLCLTNRETDIQN